MTEFKDRIEKPDGYVMPAVKLTHAEDHLYHGCGWCVVFESESKDGQIDNLVYLHNTPLGKFEDLIERALDSKAWVCFASCFDLCDPIQMTPTSESEVRALLKREISAIWK